MRTVRISLPFCVLIVVLLANSGCSTTFNERLLYHLNPVNYKDPIINNTIKDPVFVALVAATALSFIGKRDTQDWLTDHHYITGPDGEQAGDAILAVMPAASMLSLTLPQYLATHGREDENSTIPGWHMVVEGAEVGAETFLWNEGLTESLKVVIHEERPDSTRESTSYHSFPSGHATATFASATLMDRALKSEIEINGWDPNWRYLSIIPYSAASFAAISRVEHQEHYLPDIFAGAALGRAVANVIYDLHYEVPKEGTPMEKRENMLKIHGRWIPMISRDLIGIQYSASF